MPCHSPVVCRPTTQLPSLQVCDLQGMPGRQHGTPPKFEPGRLAHAPLRLTTGCAAVCGSTSLDDTESGDDGHHAACRIHTPRNGLRVHALCTYGVCLAAHPAPFDALFLLDRAYFAPIHVRYTAKHGANTERYTTGIPRNTAAPAQVAALVAYRHTALHASIRVEASEFVALEP